MNDLVKRRSRLEETSCGDGLSEFFVSRLLSTVSGANNKMLT